MSCRAAGEPPPILALPTQLAALLGPAVPGAACAGRPELFDPPAAGEHPDDVDYRHRAAVTVCSSCPALSTCEQAVHAFRSQRGSNGFVLAGRLIDGQRW